MKVLIVEDEELTADHFRQLLRRCDQSIEVLGHTCSVKNTLEWLEKHPSPDLIFLDIERRINKLSQGLLRLIIFFKQLKFNLST